MSIRMFEPDGPYVIPFHRNPSGRMIPPGCKEFWEENPGLADLSGCYVFGIRAGGGITPYYVGKASRSFKQECFTDHKVGRHYNPRLTQVVRGTPVMLFVKAPRSYSAAQAAAIAEVEKFLIGEAVRKNPNLSNRHHTRGPEWGISGVLRNGRGKASKNAMNLRRAIGW